MSIQDVLAAASSQSDADESAKDLARKCGYGVAALTIAPLPLTEVAILSVHVGMVIGIGQAYGQTMTRGPATQFILRIGAAVGLSYVGTEVAITAARNLLPFVGSFIAGAAGASFRYASTICLGAVARVYFKNQGEISDAEIKSVFKDQFDTAKKSFSMSEAKSSSAKELAAAAVKEAKDTKDTAPTPDASPTLAPEYAKAAAEDPVARLERLKSLLDKKLIDQAEYDTVKQRILDTI